MRNLWHSLRALLGRKITQRLRRTTRPAVEALEDRRLMTQRIWDGGGLTNDLWTNRFNWEENIAPVANDELVFPDGIGELDRTMNNNFPDGTLFTKITISGEGYVLKGNTLSVGAGGISVEAGNPFKPDTIELDLVLGAGQNRIDVADDLQLNIVATISGAGDLVISGLGAVALSGNTSNTFTGKTILNADSALLLNKTDAIAVPGTLEVRGSVQYGTPDESIGGEDIADDANVFLFSGSISLRHADRETLGSLTITGGHVSKLDDPTLAIQRSLELGPGFISDVGTNLALGNSATIKVGGGSTLTFTGQVSGGALNKTGVGTLVVNPQTGVNTYGATNIIEGTLEAKSAVGRRVVIPGNLNVGTGPGDGTATFGLDGTNEVVVDTAVVSVGSRGLVSVRNGAQESVRRLVKVDRLVPRIDGRATVESGARLKVKEDLTLAGATLEILGANSQVTVFGPASTVRGTLRPSGGGTLELRNGLTMTGGLADAIGANSKVLLAGKLTTKASTAAATINGKLELTNGNHVFEVANGGADKDLLINAVIQNAAGATASITKTGPGKLELKGNNTYTGTTTIAAGILLVNGVNPPNQGQYLVNSGGELRGLGTISTLALNGIVSPGDGSGGLLKVLGDTIFGESTKYVAHIDGTTVPAFDQIRTDRLFLNQTAGLRPILEPKVSFAAPLGQNFRLIDITGSTPLAVDQFFQTVGGLAITEGTTFTADGQNFTISYFGGDGNDVVITRNTGPAFAHRQITPEITEGETAFITGHITEPNHNDTFFLDVDWGDGTPLQTFTFPPGSPKDIKVGHKYLDNPRDDDHYDVELLWRDQHGGSNHGELETVVRNKAPILGAITTSLPPFVVGQPITVRGSINDVPPDTFKVHVRWDLNGPWQAINLPAGTKFFELKHTYAKAGDHHVTVLLIDDDLDFDEVSFLLNVS